MIAMLCVVSLGALVSSASGSEAPLADEAAVRLAEQVSANLGEARFACLAQVSESGVGRSGPSTGHAVKAGYDLLVTARGALPEARRLMRAHPGIRAIEVVDPRYSLASMRHLEQLVRSAMARFPSAGVVFEPFQPAIRPQPSTSRCPEVQIELDGMPQAVIAGGPPPSPEEAESAAAAGELATRYGRLQITVLE